MLLSFLHSCVKYGSYKGLTLEFLIIFLILSFVKYGSYKGLTPSIHNSFLSVLTSVKYGSYKGLTPERMNKGEENAVQLNMVLIKD